jgi:cob(I)alamin adenosyltransferase
LETTAKNAGSMRDDSRRFERPADSRRRIQCSSAIEELIAHIGFARSICPDARVRDLIKALQMDLYRLGAVIAGPPVAKKPAATISRAMMDLLDAETRRLKRLPGVLRNGSLFCEQPPAAALDVARTVCRRAERLAKNLPNQGQPDVSSIEVYLSRLTDLLWLLSQLLESRPGVNPQTGK